MTFITTDDGREVCAWCGDGKWLNYNGDCESCMAMPAEPNGPEYAHNAVGYAHPDYDGMPVDGGDYLARAGMDSDERLLEWREEFANARLDAAGRL